MKPSPTARPFDENGMPSDTRCSSMVMPGSQYRFVEAREAVALAVATLVALFLAGVVVARRRPGWAAGSGGARGRCLRP